MKLTASSISGVVFAILFVLGMAMMSLPVGGGSSTDEEIRDFYADSGDRTRVVISMYLLVLSAIAFMVFLAGLYSSVRWPRDSGEDRELPLATLITGIAFAAMLLAGAAALGAIAGGIQLGDEPETLGDTGIARFLGHTGYALILVCGALTAAAMIALVSMRILQNEALAPRWVAWVGFALAVVLLAGIIWLPMVALPLWVLIASFTVLARETSRETASLGRPATNI